MNGILIALIASYILTWLSGLYISRQTRMNRAAARRLHFTLSLGT